MDEVGGKRPVIGGCLFNGVSGAERVGVPYYPCEDFCDELDACDEPGFAMIEATTSFILPHEEGAPHAAADAVVVRCGVE